MKLDKTAIDHWVAVFKRVIADGPNKDIANLLLRLDLYTEYLEEQEESRDDDGGVFDWGQTNPGGNILDY